MSRVLVIGGTGVLGQELLSRLLAAGNKVRATSRHPRPEQGPVEWARVDLGTGAGLEAALADMEAVINTAHGLSRVNVGGTERLLAAGERTGIRHLLYPSIVGIDRVSFGYYTQKLDAEHLIEAGPVPWSILRATQFDEMIDRVLRFAARLPVMPLPTEAKLQAVAAGEVAQVLVDQVAQGPGGHLPDFTGPQIMTLAEMAQIWLEARRMTKRMIQVPVPGALGRALRQGLLTEPGAGHGSATWAEWLSRKYAAHNSVVGGIE